MTTSYINPKLSATPRGAGSVLGSAPCALMEQRDLPLLPGCLPLPCQSTTNQNCPSLCPKTFFPISNSRQIPAPRFLRGSGENVGASSQTMWEKEHPDGFIGILRSALIPLRVLNQDPQFLCIAEWRHWDQAHSLCLSLMKIALLSTSFLNLKKRGYIDVPQTQS